jgi:homoserine dehydrogenase
MSAPLRIGIAGLGTVGGGVVEMLRANGDLIAEQAGRPVVIAGVSARRRGAPRAVDIGSYRWFDDPVVMVCDAQIDLVVELIGGSAGPALAVVETAIDLGKAVVTANKSLLAHHGQRLGLAARQKNVALRFEASVAGGIPIVKALREGLAGNRIARISGILNGTCNYILSVMRETGRDFADVLKEAQDLGYAEADPGLDIDGFDAAHKLTVLSSIAFGAPPDLGAVYVEGVRHVSKIDIEYAEELGYRIKLLGTAALTPRGIEQRVHPTLVPAASALAQVEGVLNAVVVEGDFVGEVMLRGRGAGAGPTASAVIADIIDVARGNMLPAFPAAAPGAGSPLLKTVPIAEHSGPCYVRMMALDQPGVIADIAAELRNESVSVEAMIQRRHAPGEPVPVVLTTHPSQERALGRALRRISELGTMLEPPRMFRIEP